MIHLNLMEELTAPVISRMPAVEFCARGAQSEDNRHIYEVEMCENLTLVMDELQALELCNALLDALPPQELTPDADAGDEWKEAA